jgi:hypothetical protein
MVAPVVGASPAAAVTGLERRISVDQAPNTEPGKTATAFCQPGDVVVGGGAWADDFGANRVMLTQLQPVKGGSTTLDRFVAGAQAPPGFNGSWDLTAYALCADPLDGHQIVSHVTDPASPTFLATAAECPGAKLTIGTGSRILTPARRVGLQLSRPSGPLDISRSTAREIVGGNPDNWRLVSYAICTDPIPGVAVRGTLTNTAGGFFRCPSGYVHAVAGGGSLTDPGPVFLQVMYPFQDLRSVQVFMTGPAIGGIAVQAVCGPLITP